MTVAATLPITAFAVTLWGDRAFSEEAQIIRKLIEGCAQFAR
jgi:hypothetical protein